MRPRLARSAWIIACALGAGQAYASSDAPVLPCDGRAPVPAFSSDPATPQMRVWSDLEWAAPSCIGWPAGRYRFVVALAGELQAGGSDEILARLGAISSTKGLQYWSVTEQSWRVLIEDATALSGDAHTEPRPDFTAVEMTPGAKLYFREKDNRSSRPVTYRMRVVQATQEQVVVETTNADPIKSFGITFFPPGSLRTAYLAQRGNRGRWSLYLVSAATEAASKLVAVGKDSYVNRAVAAFRHASGAPTSGERAAGGARPTERAFQ